MGNCLSGGNPDSVRSKAIDKQLKHEEKRQKTEVKLLLLGAGESGKSTILKQMRLIHASGFSPVERENFRLVVFSNMTEAMHAMLQAMEQLKIPMESKQNLAYVPLFSESPSITPGKTYPRDYYRPIKALWADSGVQEAFRHSNTFPLNDNVSYFFDQLDRLFAENYIPTDQDIIRCRVKTTGIVETVFQLGPLTYRMFDVGGQRSERKKWIHCFENVTALLFVVAISGYDQCLVEDKDANQMQEALMLYDSICNSQWFINTSMILFLNKIDIFREKIHYSPVSRYFPDYTGPNDDLHQTRAYFRQRFQRLNRSENKEVYPHFTDATDTNLLRHVMTAVSDIILNENLQLLLL
ncbi:hypothetical protein BZG36_03799 [Bifiguratus adelaidae]|uniref:Guanine nucleotide-binding protein alpha-2 subunit n=1 Tax=Bifiguratus adelaidae TaxID=1938954 RepID=A0A261XWZ1_9FUNG|nr:hypothetical protein BZG36_03799 [Bifiguratus adelaidae]